MWSYAARTSPTVAAITLVTRGFVKGVLHFICVFVLRALYRMQVLVGAAVAARVETAAAAAIADRGHLALAIPGGSVLKMRVYGALPCDSRCSAATRCWRGGSVAAAQPAAADWSRVYRLQGTAPSWAAQCTLAYGRP